MTIIFYDINLKNLKVYISDIVDRLIETDNVILLYDEFDKEGYEYYKNKNCIILRNKAVTYNAIRKKLLAFNPDLLVVNAQRLSDTAFVSVAKQLGIKTVMIQHGMYIPFMKREKFFLIKKIFKTIKYFLYSQVIAKAVNKNGIEVFKKYLQTFIKGKIYKEAIDFHKQINVDLVLVYGEYWKQYHKDIFGYELNQQKVIGYHELKKVSSILSKPYEKDAICYIAQTLVEDGRIDKEEMIKFYDILEKTAKNKKVYIKLHPRTDKTIFQNRNFILLEDEIPYCSVYVGHYSSLIALVGYLDTKLILFELKGHEIPHYFKEIASYIVDNHDSFNIALNSSKKKRNNKISYYFSNNYNIDNIIKILKELKKGTGEISLTR